MKKIAFLMTLSAVLAGCADLPSAAKPSLVNSETSVRPQIQSVAPTSAGSLVPAAQVNAVAYRGLFEERRAVRVGDTLTVLLNETTRASKDIGTNARRLSSNGLNAGLNVRNGTAAPTTLNGGLNTSGNTNFFSCE